MFTFGREHEKKCAVSDIKDADQQELMIRVVDLVHDVLEGKATDHDIHEVLKESFSQGKSGVWEQTGSWIRRLAIRNKANLEVWRSLASSEDWKTRFRVACFMDEFPPQLAKEIGELLTIDRSKRVRSMAAARLREIGLITPIGN